MALNFTDLSDTQDFFAYPTDKMLAAVSTGAELKAAIRDLNKAGFQADEIEVLCGKQGAENLDVTGEHHGILARLYRFMEKFGDMESKHLREYQEELRGGHYLLAIRAPDEEQRNRALRILQSHGGHRINFYGKFAVTGLAQ